jgi:hypothetical protein
VFFWVNCTTWICYDCLYRLLCVGGVLSKTGISFQSAMVKPGKEEGGHMPDGRETPNVQRCGERTALHSKSCPPCAGSAPARLCNCQRLSCHQPEPVVAVISGGRFPRIFRWSREHRSLCSVWRDCVAAGRSPGICFSATCDLSSALRWAFLCRCALPSVV